MATSLPIYVIISIIVCSPLPPVATLSNSRVTKNNGFSMDLIHRDSLFSPWHDSSVSHPMRINEALNRSKSRAEYFALRIIDSASEKMMVSGGEYLMKLSIGTPPVEVVGLADIESDLSWTQCAPCAHCYVQNHPFFTPTKSSTYKEVPRNSTLCKSVQGLVIPGDKTKCTYSILYLDGNISQGVVSLDTINLNSTSGGPTFTNRNFIFGCATENMGKFNPESSGRIGLGGGPSSLISQMNSIIGGKFSYCLVSLPQSNLKPSKMNFGAKADVSGAGVVSTGLQIFQNSFYAVRYKGFSVGTNKLFTTSLSNSSSKVFGLFSSTMTIDTGTVLTYLPRKHYFSLEAAMKKAMKLQVVNPQGILRLCYKTENGRIQAPAVTVNFVGANVNLNPANSFLKISENIHCFAFVPHLDNGGHAILGTLAQTNFRVGYDLMKKRVYFKPTDCSKQ